MAAKRKSGRAKAKGSKRKPRAKAEIAAESLKSRATQVAEAAREDKVLFIRDMMASAEWERGKTSKALAAIWAQPIGTVESYSAEASRRLRDVVDAAHIRAKLVGLLDEAADFARTEGGGGEFMSPARAAQAMASVVKTYAEVTGIATTKHEVTGKDGGPLAITAPTILLPPETDD